MLRITHVEMLPLETKYFGGKLLPHSDLRGGGGFLVEVSPSLLTLFPLTYVCMYLDIRITQQQKQTTRHTECGAILNNSTFRYQD
jgi:hypothetical protein